jgi:Bacterial Ig-like domain (group 2)
MEKRILAILSLLLLLPVFSSGGASFTNRFNSGFDFVAHGVIGNTNWDGVYLGSGDVLNGNDGGDGSGDTIQANETNAPGFLTLQTVGGTWVGAGDDGFFAYKLVAGDFDVSVEVAPPWTAQPYALGGLLVRAWNTNNSGAPASFTGSPSENWLALWRFQLFNINLIREATNGFDAEANFPESDSDTNASRYFRITRTGDVFAFYWKTKASDAWTLITNATAAGGYVPATGSLARPDWHDQPVQVGIAQSTGTGNSPIERYADFELSGTNVTFPAMPPAPSGLLVTATNPPGALTFSWTPGNPDDNSLIVMKQTGVSLNPNIQQNPINDITYTADARFGTPGTRLGDANEYVVFSGPGNNCTVSNLGPNRTQYVVAIYEYTNTVSPVYNTASPLTNICSGPGVITNVVVRLNATSIPVGGAALATLLLSYSAGQTNAVPWGDPSVIWSSSDTNVATVGADGTVNGVGIGSASITGALSGFQASAMMTVHAPAFTDGFTDTNDFLNQGLLGSSWDGLYLKFGDVPGGSPGADGAGLTTALNSQIATANGLQISSLQSDWQGTDDDGPFLFKLAPGGLNAVSGDFEAIAHVFNQSPLNFDSAGIMARLYNATNGGPGPANAENHVNYWKAQNAWTYVRFTQKGAATTVLAAGPVETNTWLLLQRVASTNFYFFEKSVGNGPWTFLTNAVLAAASNNAPMQVGLAQQTLTSITGQAVIDHFMLDAPGIVAPFTPPPPAFDATAILNADNSITISYTVGTNADGTAVGSVVVMRANGPVTEQPYTGMALPGNPSFGDPNNDLGSGNYVVYRSPSGGSQTNLSVTVTNLIPGTTYFAVIYTFVGDGASRTYNERGTAAGPPLPLLGITATIPPIPLNGIGLLQVTGQYSKGPPQPLLIGPDNPVVISGNTNVVKVLNGIATGVGLGTTTVAVIYLNSAGSVSNVCSVTVHPPTFSDDFGTNHDYLQDGVAGTIYDGIYDASGSYPIPGSSYVPPAGSGTLDADANMTSNHVLTITGNGDGWENVESGGFFLFKYVPGDFQMAVHLKSFTVTNYNQPGLLARAYAATNGILGQPLGYEVPGINGTNDASEYWVSLTRFDEFEIGSMARLNTDAQVHPNSQPDQGDTNTWLLIVRSSGTNFSFYQKLNLSNPWQNLPLKPVYHVPQFAGRPMQVGLMAGDWNLAPAPPNSVSFEGFMLDLATSDLSLQATGNGAGTVTLSWPADPNSELEFSPTLDTPDWQPVGGTPTLDNDGQFHLSAPITGGGGFFRLRH